MIRKYSLFFMLFIVSNILVAEELFISVEYLEYFNPSYVLVHTLSGDVLNYQKIKSSDYRRGARIKLENTSGSDLILTTITIRTFRGEEFFLNQSFFDVKDGYELHYEDFNSSFRDNIGYGLSINIEETSFFGDIERIDNEYKLWNDNSIHLRRITNKNAPVFLTLTTKSPKQNWYYLENITTPWGRGAKIDLNANHFIPFNNSFKLEFSKKIDDIRIRILTELTGYPISCSIGRWIVI